MSSRRRAPGGDGRASSGASSRTCASGTTPRRRSAVYLIPGLVVVLIMAVTIQQTANTLVREKETGTVEQLTASPLRPWELMVGKLAPWAGLAALDVAGITLVGLLLFGVPFRGSVWLYVLASALFIAGLPRLRAHHLGARVLDRGGEHAVGCCCRSCPGSCSRASSSRYATCRRCCSW